MIIKQFVHDIDDGGLSESAVITFGQAPHGWPGIKPDQMPPSLVEAMRAYGTGTVTEPVTWMIENIQMAYSRFGGFVAEFEINLRRISPSVVGPHDGNAWWSIRPRLADDTLSLLGE